MTSRSNCPKRLHGFADASAPMEVRSVRVQAVGAIHRPAARRWQRQQEETRAAARRRVWHGGDWRVFDVVPRAALDAGARLRGPVMVEQPDTTLTIPPGWHATVHESGTLMMEQADANA
jgi:N-methylhydantoinase A